ncbi:MAG: rhodanese-like domain-containing protein [Lentisphaeria bacterium]|nr:rhodanese-like domain-containing protein [Lentisphaeria bacterium]MBO5990660.1 rhodanese-like domain-containing protein [Lentisphaeria bacterium]
MKKFWLMVIAAASGVLSGCSSGDGMPVAGKSYQFVIDVRTLAEQQQFGAIKGAILIEHTKIGDEISEVVPDKTSSIALFCRSGRRSAIAAGKLRELGYSNVTDLGAFSDAKKLLEDSDK